MKPLLLLSLLTVCTYFSSGQTFEKPIVFNINQVYLADENLFQPYKWFLSPDGIKSISYPNNIKGIRALKKTMKKLDLNLSSPIHSQTLEIDSTQITYQYFESEEIKFPNAYVYELNNELVLCVGLDK